MKEIKIGIEAIRVQMGIPRVEMAKRLGVNIDRYNRLATGESKMLATEFIKLHEISGLPWENIGVTY